MRHYIIAEGSKSGKGGSSYRAPVESANTLRAIQYATIVDVVSEGPIVGLEDGDKSIYLNETPLRTSGGTLTMQDVGWETRYGLPEQEPLPYADASSAEYSVGVEVTNLYPRAVGPDSGKYQFSVTNPLITRLRVTLGVNALYRTLTNQSNAGDIVPTSLSYRVCLRNNSDETIYETSRKLEGKTMSQYLWELLIDLDDNGPWLCTVEKTSTDSTTSYNINDLYLSSYTEIIGYSFSYPNTAIVAVSASAESFGNTVPTRAYKIKGLIVKVPDNYDSENRTYTGIWDGTFKSAWTDNPAWVFYDLVTNERYGAAYYLPWAYTSACELCDKWFLYEIARICDELVPDGYGGYEPRYTLNYQIFGAENAAQVLQSVASVFHGMSYWSSGLVFAKCDYPTDPLRTINQTNVIEGKITYSTGSIQERHSVVLVTWNDPDDMYKSAIEAVYDWDLVEKFGYNPVSSVAYGCTSRGQAYRHGLWVLATEADDFIATVEMGLDSFDYLPGDIVRIADPAFMGFRAGGRIKAISGRTITLDADFEAVSGETYTLVINTSDGGEESRKATAIEGARVTVASPYSKEFVELPVWSMLGSRSAPGQYSITKITEKSKGRLEVQLKEVNPNKYAQIEQGLTLERLPTQRQERNAPEAPSGLKVTETTVVENNDLVNKVVLSWEAYTSSDFGAAVKWRVETKDPFGNVRLYDWQDVNYLELSGIVTGTWDFSVMGQASSGLMSVWSLITRDIMGVEPPADITGLRVRQDGDVVDLLWDANTDLNFSHYEVREGYSWETGALVAQALTAPNLVAPVSFEREHTFWVKAVNSVGGYSRNAAGLSIVVSDLSGKNVFVAWDEFSGLRWSDVAGVTWEDMNGLTWQNVYDGEHDNTCFAQNDLTLLSIDGTWEEQGFVTTWQDYGGQEVLTLIDGTASGTWTSAVKDLGKILNAEVYHDINAIALGGASVRIEVRTSLDGEFWGGWAEFIRHNTTLRYIQYRLILTSANLDNPPRVTRLYVVVDMPDVIHSGRQLVGIGGTVIEYGFDYTIQPSVVITADGAENQAKLIGGPEVSNCIVKVIGVNDEDVGGIVNWTVRGY